MGQSWRNDIEILGHVSKIKMYYFKKVFSDHLFRIFACVRNHPPMTVLGFSDIQIDVCPFQSFYKQT